ncbi:tRNA guanosine-2'-O-methyltransferase TRM13 [Angomonas deanei]|nr:tRNA guanosine-2'-O-methyltransferase TRM13 [Angomonas deanei]|eukprot:EPY30347.1 tRNA guanosine-2'-O-methyltransferase TRM13 [Angomonas deanei]
MNHDGTDQKTQLWHRLIDEYSCCQPDRSHVHELENLPQEIAIGELLMDCVSKVQKTEPSFKLELVVDVGGGNGFMAAVVGEKLKSDSLVIDPFFPGHSIDCCPRLWKDTPEEARVRPSKPRKYTIHRQMALFKDTTWSEDIGTDPSCTAFIAKHLCGSAIDECLRHLEQQKCLPRILVLAPCCFHRCDYDTYISHDFLKDVLGVEDEMSFRSVTRITDWSKSTYQEEHKKKMKNGKHHGKKTMHDLIPCSNGLAYTVEALLNYGRALWLEKHGYVVHRVQYVPSTVTPKNKCIVAVRYSQ